MAAAKTIRSLLLLLAAVALPLATSSRPKKSYVVVEGVVDCQSCKYVGSGSLNDAVPIPSAEVSVTCKNSAGGQAADFYQTNKTDSHGYFYSWVQGFKLGGGKMDPQQACTVKLVSSPLANCNVATNVNGGADGAKLRYGKVETSPHGYQVFYYSAAGPLAFRPEMCAN